MFIAAVKRNAPTIIKLIFDKYNIQHFVWSERAPTYVFRGKTITSGVIPKSFVDRCGVHLFKTTVTKHDILTVLGNYIEIIDCPLPTWQKTNATLASIFTPSILESFGISFTKDANNQIFELSDLEPITQVNTQVLDFLMKKSGYTSFKEVEDAIEAVKVQIKTHYQAISELESLIGKN